LIALFVSQLGIAAGALRVRLFGAAGLSHLLPPGVFHIASRWPAVVLAATIIFEIALVAWAGPYIVSSAGRAQAAESFSSAWHICSVASAMAGQALGAAIQ
jgi:hypothetical protein